MPVYVYVLVPLVVGLFVFQIVWKARAAVRHLARARTSYRGSDVPTLMDDELFALAVGAINGEQLTANVDSLETGIDKARVKQGLTQAWTVSGSDDAHAVLGWLLAEGHRVHFDEVMRLHKAGEKTDDAKLAEWVQNLGEALPAVRASGLAPDDQPSHGILAWDLGRAVNVARLAFDAGYISRDDAWSAINNAAEHARAAFSSWKDLAASYLVGRAMWGGTGVMLDGLIVVTQGLLKDTESPWQQVEFQSRDATQVMRH